jgi:hypothetical protein
VRERWNIFKNAACSSELSASSTQPEYLHLSLNKANKAVETNCLPLTLQEVAHLNR